jgi:hypothetical protein
MCREAWRGESRGKPTTHPAPTYAQRISTRTRSVVRSGQLGKCGAAQASGDGGGQTADQYKPQRYAEKCKNALYTRCPLWLKISHKLYISIAMPAAGSTHQHPRLPPAHTSNNPGSVLCRKEAGWNYIYFIINHR